MKYHRKKKLGIALFIVISVSAAASLSLYALRQSINLFYTPTQLLTANLSDNQEVRVGGIVEKNSVHFAQQGVLVNFVVGDGKETVKVQYNGVLPALFREGQDIVAQGKLTTQKIFLADQVLAKHDANYHPVQLSQLTK